MQRLCGQKTASCFQRCVGMDAFNAVYSTTYEIDEKYGTNYHKNFVEYLKYVQENDLVVDGAMTDPKGDRSLAPHAQPDPDLFLRIKEIREDGIVVRGAKCHQTGSINSHEHLIMPTMAMKEEDKMYAVSFAIQSDADGVFMIYGRQSCDTRKLEEGADVDLGNKQFGGQEALVVFDDVFIPNDRIFLCGETEFAGTNNLKVGEIVYKGKFLMPVENFNIVTSGFGSREGGGVVSSNHKGIDLVGDKNSNILCVKAGTVTWAGWQSGYGNCVEIMHTDENGKTFYTFYAHMQDNSLKVKENQQVIEGQIIGIQGTTRQFYWRPFAF